MPTKRETVVFENPFRLEGVDALQPAGRYIVETNEERIEGLSRLAYRRVSTSIHVRPPGGGASSSEVVIINPDELAAALLKDKNLTIASEESA